jgi:hypothetical protein
MTKGRFLIVLATASLIAFMTIEVQAMSNDTDGVLLEARYTAVAGSDPEYGQGAIERNDLRHREIEHFIWLVLVDAPGDPAAWQKKLNASVDGPHGSFTVTKASPEEEEKVRSGKITLQR